MPEGMFKSWYADPEFMELDPARKANIFINFFDKEMADEEFFSLPAERQGNIKSNFLSSQGISQARSTTTTRETDLIDTIGDAVKESIDYWKEPAKEVVSNTLDFYTQEPSREDVPEQYADELPSEDFIGSRPRSEDGKIKFKLPIADPGTIPEQYADELPESFEDPGTRLGEPEEDDDPKVPEKRSTASEVLSLVPFATLSALHGATKPFLAPLEGTFADTNKLLKEAVEYWKEKSSEGPDMPNFGVGFDKEGDLEFQSREPISTREIIGATAEGVGFIGGPVMAAGKAAGLVVPKIASKARPFYQHILKGMITGALVGEGKKEETLQNMALFGVFEPVAYALGRVTQAPKAIKDSTAWRNMTIKERGLVVQSLDDVIQKGELSEAEILRRWNNPTWREQALQRRNVGEKRPTEDIKEPVNISEEMGYGEGEIIELTDVVERPPIISRPPHEIPVEGMRGFVPPDPVKPPQDALAEQDPYLGMPSEGIVDPDVILPTSKQGQTQEMVGEAPTVEEPAGVKQPWEMSKDERRGVIRETRTLLEDSAVASVESEINTLGRERLEKARIIKPGQSTSDWLNEWANSKTTWGKGGHRTGGTALQILSQKNLWTESGEPLRKAALGYIKSRNKSFFGTKQEQEKYYDDLRDVDNIHKREIQQAIKEGKPIPESVLNEYPDLQPTPSVEKPTGINENELNRIEENIGAKPQPKQDIVDSGAPGGVGKEPDAIRSAAYRFADGTVHEGSSHPGIASDLVDQKKWPGFDEVGKSIESGFVTKDGKFVDRDEAVKLSGAANAEDIAGPFGFAPPKQPTPQQPQPKQDVVETPKEAVGGKEPIAPTIDRKSVTKAMEQRGVKGDALLDSEDLVDDLVDKGGVIDKDGMVTLYHRTTPENAKKIADSQSISGKEDRLFFGTKPSGQIDGYGDGVVEVTLPIEKLELNDVFSDEAHVTYKSGRPGTFVPIKAKVYSEVASTPDTGKAKVAPDSTVEKRVTGTRHSVFMDKMEKKYGSAALLEMTDMEHAAEKDLSKTIVSEIKEQYKKDHGDKPIVLTNDKETLGVMITQSSKEPGKVQLTRWDNRGFSGDTTFDTEEQAILDAYKDRYRNPNPGLLEKLTTTKDFIEGNKFADRVEKENQKSWEKVQERRKEEEEPAVKSEKRVAVNWRKKGERFIYEGHDFADVVGFGKPGNYQIWGIPESKLKQARAMGATLNKGVTSSMKQPPTATPKDTKPIQGATTQEQAKARSRQSKAAKDDLVSQVDAAIKNAPEEMVDGDPPVTFTSGGATFTIPNQKSSLVDFRDAAKKMQTTASTGIIKVKQNSVGKPTLHTQESVGELVVIEDNKEWFTDGNLLVKGTPPKKAKNGPVVMKWAQVKTILDVKNPLDATLKYYATSDAYYEGGKKGDLVEEIGTGISKEPIVNITNEVKSESKDPVVVFKAGKKRYPYSQAKFNVIKKRYPDATYKIDPNSNAKLLVAYDDGKIVGVLTAMLSRGQRDIPGIKMAAQSGYADTGGYATNIKSVIELPEIVYLAKELMKGKYPKIVEKIRKSGAVGLFHPTGDGKIDILASLFQDPDQAAATLSHEIGHLIDYLPEKDLKRGNILGRIASLKKYMKHSLPKSPGAPGALTEKDRRRLRYEAKKLIESETKDKWIDEEIEQTFPISPQDILNIWNAVDAAKGNPELMDYVKRLNTAEKKSIVKEALKGQVADQLSQFAKRIKTKTGKKIKVEGVVSKDMILKRYEKLIKDELKKRELFTRDEISNELKILTRTWKPFDPTADAKYTKYRYSGPELYADAISALINAPGLLKSTAPKFYEAFFNYMENKPEVKRLYDKIQNDISSGQNYPDARKRVRAGFDKKEEQWVEDLTSKGKISTNDAWGTALIDKAWSITRRVNKVDGNVPDSKDPRHKLDDMLYTPAEVEGYLAEAERRFLLPLDKIGMSRKDFGEYLFYRRVANEKVTKAASQGITPKRAKMYMADIEAKYGDSVIEKAKDFHKFRKEWILDKLNEAKMHSPELLKMISENETYVTFDVVQNSKESHGNALTSHIYRRVGHLGDIGDPFTATLLKDTYLIRAANQNEAAKSVIEFMETYYGSEIKSAETKWNGKFHEIQQPSDPNLRLIGYLKDGKPVGKYVSKYIATSFEHNPIETMLVAQILRYTGQPFKEVFTGKNPGFWGFNIIRDYERSLKNIKGATMRKWTPEYLRGISPAFRSVFGVPDDLIKKFQKDKMLISVLNYRGDVPEDTMHERMLKRYSIHPNIWKNKVLKPISLFWYYLDGVGRSLERIPKFGGYLYLKKHYPDMPDELVKHMIRHRIGSPSFLTRGTAAPITNTLLFYSNAATQGWREDINVFKENKGDYAFKTGKYVILPKLAQFAVEMGLLGGLISLFTGDDDEDTYKSMMDNISSYDKANYTNIPLGVTPHGATVHLRIPQDETSRLIGGITWKMMNYQKPEMATNLFDYMAGQAPAIHPGIKILWAVTDFASGRNHYDSFRGRNAINDQVLAAGGTRAAKAMGKWLWDQAGLGIIHRFSSGNPNKIKTELEKVLGFPVASNILGRFIKVSNYGTREKYKEVLKPIRKKKAEKSLLKGEAIQKTLNGEQLTDDEAAAMVGSVETLPLAYRKAIASRYGNVFLEMLYAAQGTEENVALWGKFFELHPGAMEEFKEAVNQ
jgi:hypothetical protein